MSSSSNNTSGLVKFKSIWSSLKVVQTRRFPADVVTAVSKGKLRGRTTPETSTLGIDFDKVAPSRGDAGLVILEPSALARNMVQHQVEHQPEVLTQGLNGGPVAPLRIHVSKWITEKPSSDEYGKKGSR